MRVNVFLIIMVVLLFVKVVNGYKKGMVREIISLISLIFLCLVAALVGNGILGYLNHEKLTVAVMVFLLALLGIAHHFLNMVIFPAKLIAGLPILHSVDKLLGVALGLAETILILWTIDTFIMMPQAGATGQYILQCTAENPVLAWLFEHNQLEGWIAMLGASLDEKLHLPSVSIQIGQ